MSARPQVVILAGGLGTRLRPITEKIPKPLVEVAGRPFLDWQLQDLKLQGYHDILLLVSYLGEKIEAAYGDGRRMGLRIRYSYETEPMGTGGALKNALPLLEERFILLNGDSFLRAPLDRFVAAFDRSQFSAMISTYDGRAAGPFSVPVPANLQCAGERVLAYKKGAGREQGFTDVDSGVYIVKRELLQSTVESRFQLEAFWPALINSGRLGVFPVAERFYDIGTPERLREFEEKVRDYFPHPF